MKQITRREFVREAAVSAAAVSLVSCSLSAKAEQKSPKRPNLVFVFPDEFRKQAIGFMKQDPVITPHLDRFAAESLVLTDAVSNRPVCSPFRAMLLTGKYPFSNGVTTNCWSATVKHGIRLRESEKCISDVLQDKGYHLGYIGKWHLEAPEEPYVYPLGPNNAWDEFTPPGPRRHGFDFWHSYGCWDDHLKPHYWSTDAARNESKVVEEWSPKHEADVAISYIQNRDGKQRDPGKPFALFLSMNPPHMPWGKVPQKYVEMYGEKTCEELLTRPNVDLSAPAAAPARKWARHYFAAVTGVDEQFGRILQSLKQEGLEENTIVVFTSDHGEMMGSHGLMYKNWWYEESMGIPFLIRWPGRIPPRRDNLLLSVPDMMPTLLGLMGLADAIPTAVEGRDYSSLMLGKGGTRFQSALYLNVDPTGAERGARGVRTSRYTYVVRRGQDGGEGGDKVERFLYDNEKDPYQMKSIAAEYPKQAEQLHKELVYWLERTRDPELDRFKSM